MTREQLIACLAENAEHSWYPPGEYDRRYVDWTARTGAGFLLEVGDETDAVQLELTRDELLAIHRQLTLTLLANDGESESTT